MKKFEQTPQIADSNPESNATVVVTHRQQLRKSPPKEISIQVSPPVHQETQVQKIEGLTRNRLLPSPTKNVSIQCDKEYGMQMEQSFMFQNHHNSSNLGHASPKTGIIKKQNLGFEKASEGFAQNHPKIKDISDTVIQEHIEKQAPLNEKSTPS